jgi:hypothetical protein
VALSNQGRVFASGLIGGGSTATIEEQTERTRFRLVSLQARAKAITAGLSGAAAVTVDGRAYIWGRFGEAIINVPRRIEREKKGNSLGDDRFFSVKVGD